MKISVVIPLPEPHPRWTDCLDAAAGADEVLLVVPNGLEVEPQRAGGRLLRVPEGDIETLRMHGLRAAAGDVVALTEPWCVPREGWVDAIRTQAEAGVKAGAGPVLPCAEAGWREWTLYFARYARFAPPLEPGGLEDGSGLSVFYHRELLEEHLGALGERFPEAAFHRLLRRRGLRLQAVPGAAVTTFESQPFPRLVRSRYRSGRDWARQQRPPEPWLRWWMAARCALLPGLFWIRAARRLLARPGRVRFLLCSPALLACHAAWALGEARGCLEGEHAAVDSHLSLD